MSTRSLRDSYHLRRPEPDFETTLFPPETEKAWREMGSDDKSDAWCEEQDEARSPTRA